MKKWIAAAVVVVIVIAAAVWYKAGSAPAVAETPETAATPAPTATPEATPAATPVDTEDPTATETPADTSGKYEVSPGVYNDGTTREITSEEWGSMTQEEKDAYLSAGNKELGGQSWDDLDHVTEEEAQDAIDSFNLDNPYLKALVDEGVIHP